MGTSIVCGLLLSDSRLIILTHGAYLNPSMPSNAGLLPSSANLFCLLKYIDMQNVTIEYSICILMVAHIPGRYI